MRRTLIITSILAAAIVITASSALHSENIKGKELVGLRIGGIFSTGDIENAFGKGSEIELHFIQGIGSWYGLGLALSSHNFGRSKLPDKDIEFLGLNRRLDLQIYSLTVSFAVIKSISKRLHTTIEGGAGLYSINAVVQSGFFEGYLTDNQPGFCGGAGLLARLTKRLSADLTFKYHYIFSGSDSSHIIYFYTENGRTQIFQITAGITIFAG